MRRIILAFILLAFVAIMANCGKHNPTTDPNACTLITPVLSTPWVADITAGKDCAVFAGANLYSCTFNGQSCIYLENEATSQAVCSELLYDCKGTKLLDGASSSTSWDDFKKNVTNKVKVWSK
jgi:hypothetical protein